MARDTKCPSLTLLLIHVCTSANAEQFISTYYDWRHRVTTVLRSCCRIPRRSLYSLPDSNPDTAAVDIPKLELSVFHNIRSSSGTLLPSMEVRGSYFSGWKPVEASINPNTFSSMEARGRFHGECINFNGKLVEANTLPMEACINFNGKLVEACIEVLRKSEIVWWTPRPNARRVILCAGHKASPPSSL